MPEVNAQSKIRILRGTREKIKSSTKVYPAGTPIWNKEDNVLLISDGVTEVKNLRPMGGAEVKNEAGDVVIKASDNVTITSDTKNITLNANSGVITINGNTNIQGITPRLKTLSEDTIEFNDASPMLPNIFYKCTNTNLTSITIKNFSQVENTLGEYLLEFTTKTSVPRFSFPSTLQFANLWDKSTSWEVGYKYIIYIINNIAYVSFVKV